ncbi:MAG: bifunctional folylpolyglutamate synthase/dihydrofolate synthase [Flavobacterium sp.]|nr:bifunctional folylpolyglutamate synthase/dihydrofolate synthase [Flavobacterium sp.]
MTYHEAVHWMFNQLPMYQQQGASAFRKNLDNTYLLADYLGNPERRLKAIHVAGTNGKGSTSHMLSSVLMQAGYKVGLFTSPHLKDYRERIRINGQMISEDYVTEFVVTHKPFFEANNLSFFEMSVGLAFQYFVDQKVAIAVIETGLGGRLDSTNIITPIVSVITNIGLDHTQYLGETLAEIASEKAGIIKNNVPVVIGEYTDETKPVFHSKAKETNSALHFASDYTFEVYESDLKGYYQRHNIKTVLQTISVLNKHTDIALADQDIKQGLRQVTETTGLQGRWQKLGENPLIICDTAHNKEGLTETMAQVRDMEFETLHIVLGFVNDKSIAEILPIFPKNAKYYFCSPNLTRGLAVAELQKQAAQVGLTGNTYHSASKAYADATKNAGPTDFIYVGGSTFVVAEIL